MITHDELVSIRRDIHRHPEPGWQEFRTTALVAEELDALGFDIHFGPEVTNPADRLGVPDETVVSAARSRAREWGSPNYLDQIGGITGLIGEKSYGDGATVAFRCDLDALEQNEATGDGHRPVRETFASANPNAMHACGHDGHVAIALGLARAVVEDSGAFDGTLALIFQPAEEGLRGGLSVAESPYLSDVDYLFAYHIGLGIPSETVVAGAKGFLASTKLDVAFHGQTAHAGQSPQKGRNALHAATTTVENLFAIPRHEGGHTRVNVGRLEAGTARNAIPGEATLTLEVRGESTTLNEYMERRARNIIEATAEMHDVSVDVDIQGKAITASPSDELVSLCERGLRDAGQFETVLRHHSVNVSEDATYIMQRVQEDGGQATYVIVGADLAAGHHTPTFDFDESALLRASESFAYLVRNTIPDHS